MSGAIEPKLNIPRREILESRYRSLMNKMNKLQEEFEVERAYLETELAEVHQHMSWHGYSQQRKALIAHTLELPDEPGVYEIMVNRDVVYVGESKSIRKRAISHLQQTWKVGSSDDIAAKLYRLLASESPESISFSVAHIDVSSKQDRLRLEARLIAKRIDEGHPITNVAGLFGSTVPGDGVARTNSKGKARADRRTMIEDQEQWNELLKWMTEDVRAMHFMRSFSD